RFPLCEPRADYRIGCSSPAPCDLRATGHSRRGGLDLLRCRYRGFVPQGGFVYRPDTSRREARRTTGSTPDEVPHEHQSKGREGARLDRAEHPTCECRRGDRISLIVLRLLTAGFGTLRRFVAAHRFGRYWRTVDIRRSLAAHRSDANDPQETSR